MSCSLVQSLMVAFYSSKKKIQPFPTGDNAVLPASWHIAQNCLMFHLQMLHGLLPVQLTVTPAWWFAAVWLFYLISIYTNLGQKQTQSSHPLNILWALASARGSSETSAFPCQSIYCFLENTSAQRDLVFLGGLKWLTPLFPGCCRVACLYSILPI